MERSSGGATLHDQLGSERERACETHHIQLPSIVTILLCDVHPTAVQVSVVIEGWPLSFCVPGCCASASGQRSAKITIFMAMNMRSEGLRDRASMNGIQNAAYGTTFEISNEIKKQLTLEQYLVS